MFKRFHTINWQILGWLKILLKKYWLSMKRIVFPSVLCLGEIWAVISKLSLKQLAVSPADLVLRIQSDEWGGRWVNIGQSEIIPDKTTSNCDKNGGGGWLMSIFNIEKSRSWDDYDYRCQGIHNLDSVFIRDAGIVFIYVISSKSNSNASVFHTIK